MVKKVLVLYAEAGQGHAVSAQSIKQAFNAKYPQVKVKEVNVIDYANKLYQKTFVKGYEKVSGKMPAVWGFLYKHYDSHSRQRFLQFVSKLALESKLIPLIKDFNPDIIIATHFLPIKLISFSKQQDLIQIPSAVVVTDFGCHSFWVDDEVNYYFVATPGVGKCLQKYGVNPNQIFVTGIPINLKFSKKLSKSKLITKLGLKIGKTTVLIVGGQFNFSALSQIINGVLKKHLDGVQFLVVAGRDKTLAQAIKNSSLDKNPNVKVFGFVDNMEELMTVADLVFSKAGGLTVSECLAKGLPLVINKVIPGQEEDNVNYLTSKSAAIKAENFDGIIKAVNDLLANSQKLNQMKKVAKEIGRPNSATDLVDFVVSKIS